MVEYLDSKPNKVLEQQQDANTFFDIYKVMISKKLRLTIQSDEMKLIFDNALFSKNNPNESSN
jgi:hypothetical protein